LSERPGESIHELGRLSERPGESIHELGRLSERLGESPQWFSRFANDSSSVLFPDKYSFLRPQGPHSPYSFLKLPLITYLTMER